MGARRHNARATRLGRFMRGRRLDRNPLRRASDRAETAVLALLVIAFFAAAPFAALAAGSWATASGQRVRLSEQASFHQVSARVLKVTPTVADGGYEAGLPQAQARWTAPDGKVVTGEIFVAVGTTAGTTVPLWTTDDGQVTNPPLQSSQIRGQAYFAEGFSVVALGVVLAAAGWLARWALDRRRMASWDAEWRSAGPRWTTRA